MQGSILRRCALGVLLCLLAWPALAQHSAFHTPRSLGDVESDSIPANDEVLARAPDSLTLRFSAHVRLVKLVLRDYQQTMYSVGFFYDPVPNRVFVYELPELPPSTYYSVEWAAMDPDNQIVYGEINFSFGEEARKPSVVIAEDLANERRHIMVPDYRLLPGGANL